jgi:transposase
VDKVLYVGVDAHRATSHITIMDETGHILKRKQVPSSAAGLRQVLGHYQEPMNAVLEASYTWGPVYDWLDELVDEVILAHPAKVKAIADARIKTDTIDSATLAHLLRANLIPQAYAPSKNIRAIKRVLRQRMFLVRVQTMVKNRIHALLNQHSVERPEVSDLFGKAGLRWLRGAPLPEPDRRVLDSDLTLLEALQDRISGTTDLLKELAAGDQAVRWLSSVPGIGEFLSVLIRYEIADVRRFRTAKRFVSHTGLVPSTYGSGERLVHGHLTKRGNKWLRWAFIEAVSPAIRYSAFLRRHYDRLKARRGTKDARVSTARKLAELAWTVWREGRCYEER